jgi:hypothetical protein
MRNIVSWAEFPGRNSNEQDVNLPGGLSYSARVGDATPQTGGGGLIGSEAIAVDSLGSAYITGSAGHAAGGAGGQLKKSAIAATTVCCSSSRSSG